MKKFLVQVILLISLAVSGVAALPVFRSENKIVNDFTELALKEIQMDIRSDGTFSAGAKWPSAWTRDMSYAIDLSLSFLFPEAVEKSLASRVENGMILQDTGSGGSYPVSTDRIVWGIAAYDYALFKQDPEYFKWVYDVINKTLDNDLLVNFNSEKNIFRGETSFLDWREQTYPRWMDSVFIASSYALGTNNDYYGAIKAAEKLSHILNLSDEEKNLWNSRLLLMKEGINENFWLTEKKRYGNYIISNVYETLYSGYETLGTSLAVLNGVCEKDFWNSALNAVKPNQFGMSVVAPQLAKVPSYHNDAVWPFVQAYRGLALKKAGNAAECEKEFKAILNAAQKFGTFKENYVASTFSEETQTNSDRQLWSVAGYLAYIYRVFCGIDFTEKGIKINPLVFDSIGNHIKVDGIVFGDSVLNLSVEGSGDSIKSFVLNGKTCPADFVIPYGLKQTFNVHIQLEKSELFEKSYSENSLNAVDFEASAVSPEIPVLNVDYEKGKYSLRWRQKNEAGYEILKNGKHLKFISEQEFTVKPSDVLDVYTVQAVSDVPVLPACPLRAESPKNTWFIEAEKSAVNGGKILSEDNPEPVNAKISFELDKTSANFDSFVSRWGAAEGESITFDFKAPKDGVYAVDFRFRNGHGPVNTGESCAIAVLFANQERCQAVVLPQQGNWTSWNFTSPVLVFLQKGSNKICLQTDKTCYAQHHRLNSVDMDLCRISRVK